jgi:hypothetical protein
MTSTRRRAVNSLAHMMASSIVVLIVKKSLAGFTIIAVLNVSNYIL